MSNPSTRPYRKRKRADSEEETRRRITEAAVELHGTVGPANTTVTDVAKVAGVSRMTVYNHFPTEFDLYTACSTHWATANPFPDPSTWTVADPADRLVVALEELYEWYGLKQEMLGNVLRDIPNVPALSEVMSNLWGGFMEGAVQVLMEGWSPANVDAKALHAMLRLAVEFTTWQALTESGLDDSTAAGLMAGMVAGAAT